MTFEQIMEIVEIRKVRSDKRKEKIFNKVLNALGHIGIDMYIYIFMFMMNMFMCVCVYINTYIHIFIFLTEFLMHLVISV
jgi:hypothetical protein